MQIINASASHFPAVLQQVLSARQDDSASVAGVVQDIIKQVQKDGDAALIRLTEKFDAFTVPAGIALSADFIAAQAAKCCPKVRKALELAAARIEVFHRKQVPNNMHFTDAEGVLMGLRWQPMDAVGIYVPGGKASYPSSVLMNAIPAKVAGVSRVAMCVPMPKGEVNPAVMAAVEIAGITEVYPVGGAHAIAALAYGTAAIAPVDKITGPGNAYVAEAKRQVFGTVGIDSIAGPSEILVVADAQNNPRWIAWDLLAQAEHDEQAQSILITDCPVFAEQVVAAVAACLEEMPLKKAAIARASWQQHGLVIVVSSLWESAALINKIAPEHLALCVEKPEDLLKAVRHAGSVFLGRYTPEAIGDYLGGPNHVLPTNGTARFASGLSVYDFMKRTTFLQCSKESLAVLGESVALLATEEQLPAHARSVTERL